MVPSSSSADTNYRSSTTYYSSTDSGDYDYEISSTTYLINACHDYGGFYEEEDEPPQVDPWPFPLAEVMSIRGGTKPPEPKATARPACIPRRRLRCNRKGIGLRIKQDR